ncbi:MAG: histidine kinase [Bacteroidales bacterium]|nr:histidine kinase [Bacteroidales bacterium]MCM1146972.1 histidine kinase [Bacteroidales bacterium]MCM1205895.1 histidine kinase [Bacillota bacterium]MCM1509864.1 histidine kinase [Clostridium sp.]
MDKEKLSKELQEARIRISVLESECEAMRREIRLTKLRRQVTPHFLFNSISVAVCLITESPKLAIKFLRHLASMYRYLLKYGNEYSVPVETELEMLRQYYELMSLRHVGCLLLHVSDKASRLHGHPLPPLALQGLLENAIKHNIHTEDCPLSVTIDTDGDFLTVSNAVVPLLSDTETTHTGLAYMNETMKLLFGKEIETVNDGKTFTVRIPLVKEPGRQSCLTVYG